MKIKNTDGLKSVSAFEQYLKVIGSNVRYERLKRNLTLEDLAAILNVEPGFLGLVERGLKCISLQNLMTLAELFDLSLDQLTSWDIKLFELGCNPDTEEFHETPALKIYAILNMLKKMTNEQLNEAYRRMQFVSLSNDLESYMDFDDDEDLMQEYEKMEALRILSDNDSNSQNKK